MASRVIAVDLWWNGSVEQQAFCRSYRHGQQRETEMTRFVVKQNVDEDIIKMQEERCGDWPSHEGRTRDRQAVRKHLRRC